MNKVLSKILSISLAVSFCNAFPLSVSAATVTTRTVVAEGETKSLTEGATYTAPQTTEWGGALNVAKNATVTGKNITFSGNKVLSGSFGYGGAIYNLGTITLENATFTNNSVASSTTSGMGGAISNRGTMVFKGTTTFTGNSQTINGNWAGVGGAIQNGTGNESVSMTFEGPIIFNGNTGSRAYAAAMSNCGLFIFKDTLTLQSDTDKISSGSSSGQMVWDMSGTTKAKLIGYQRFSKSGGILKIVLPKTQSNETFTVAEGDFTDVTGKDTFVLTGAEGKADATIKIGEKAIYGEKLFNLTVSDNATPSVATDDKLILSSGAYDSVKLTNVPFVDPETGKESATYVVKSDGAIVPQNADKSFSVIKGKKVEITYTVLSGYILSNGNKTITVDMGNISKNKVLKAADKGVSVERIPEIIYYEYDSTAKKIIPKTTSVYNIVESSSTRQSWAAGTYVVNSDVTITGGVSTTGDVTLILCDDKTLTISGVEEDYAGISNGRYKFIICAESKGTGKLITSGGPEGGAGIGGSVCCYGRNITINGGTIIATGGEEAAGIGGGKYGEAENIVINGGTITANGNSDGSGIGAGSGEDVTKIYVTNSKSIIKSDGNATPTTSISNDGTEDLSSKLTGRYTTISDVVYNVTLNKDGGKCSNFTRYIYGMATVLPTPTKDGYSFLGWFDNSSFTGTAVTEISATETGNKTFYANWKLDPYAKAVEPSNTKNNPKTQGIVYDENRGALRFMWAFEFLEGTPTIENFGAYIIPFYLFDDYKDTNSVIVKYDNLAKNPSDGQTFSADLDNIPKSEFETKISAVPFINGKLQNTIWTTSVKDETTK